MIDWYLYDTFWQRKPQWFTESCIFMFLCWKFDYYDGEGHVITSSPRYYGWESWEEGKWGPILPGTNVHGSVAGSRADPQKQCWPFPSYTASKTRNIKTFIDFSCLLNAWSGKNICDILTITTKKYLDLSLSL